MPVKVPLVRVLLTSPSKITLDVPAVNKPAPKREKAGDDDVNVIVEPLAFNVASKVIVWADKA